ncbi:hypothetical protein BIW11_06596 [Tropilaelaps mercedesae]|uniref:Cuticle protein 10.9-like n=1 Tax=Tropilaelaps mercedesae TaxID=418985 RepID=A0A1V9XXC9_9ACAR|nr:hypothetical protein BIW11_06596 [Tropilaelaps mercedesae]
MYKVAVIASVAVVGWALPHAYGPGVAPLAYAAAAPVVAKIAEPVYPPQPYSFGYETVDEYGTKSARHEESDGHNNKKGSYSFTDAHGISRRVDYVADAAGFRATVNTNEPGTAPSAPAAVLFNAPAPLKKVAVAAAAPIAAYAHAPAYGHHY